MKQQIYKMLRAPLKLSKRDIILTLLPFLFWAIAVSSRVYLLEPYCPYKPMACKSESVAWLDRFALGHEDFRADQISYQTQNLSGALAVLVPLSWNLFQSWSRTIPAATLLSTIGTDIVLFAQVSGWNGLSTEVSHLISNRPRPFVYSDPIQRGTDPAHYTSFYSGHTSFAAAANTMTVLILFIRGLPALPLFLYFLFSEMLTFSTGYFRIYAGRHFPSDVICGAMAGTLIALLIIFLHKKLRK